MNECPYCKENTVGWYSDGNMTDFGFDKDGLLQIYKCGNCGAFIWVLIPEGEE